jgi:hypothetical protein
MTTRLKIIRRQNLLADLSAKISKYLFLFLCIPDCYGSHTCTKTRTSNVTDEVRDVLTCKIRLLTLTQCLQSHLYTPLLGLYRYTDFPAIDHLVVDMWMRCHTKTQLL